MKSLLPPMFLLTASSVLVLALGRPGGHEASAPKRKPIKLDRTRSSRPLAKPTSDLAAQKAEQPTPESVVADNRYGHAVIRGIVLDASRRPVAGAIVTTQFGDLRFPESTVLPGAVEIAQGEELTDRVATDSSGAFRLPARAGLKVVAAGGPGLGFAFSRPTMTRIGEMVDVGELVLPSRPSGGLHLTLTDTEGAPVPGLVMLHFAGRDRAGERRGGGLSITLDEAGEAQIPVLEFGQYEVSVTPLAAHGTRRRVVRVHAGQVTELHLSIPMAEPIRVRILDPATDRPYDRPVRFDLPFFSWRLPDAATTVTRVPPLATVTGRLTTAGGELTTLSRTRDPVEAEAIFIERHEPGSTLTLYAHRRSERLTIECADSDGEPVPARILLKEDLARPTLQTDAGGSVSLEVPESWFTEACVFHPHFGSSRRAFERREFKLTDSDGGCEILGPNHLRFVLAPEPPSTGRVIDHHGRPVAGATVIGGVCPVPGESLAGEFSTTTGDDGSFVLAGRSWSCVVFAEGFETVKSDLDDESSTTIRLKPLQPLAAQVLDEFGRPLADIPVTLVLHGAPCLIERTDAEGRVSWRYPVDYASVRATLRTGQTLSAELSPGEEAILQPAPAAPRIVVQGTLRDSSGRIAPPTRVTIYDWHGCLGVEDWTLSDERGHFSVAVPAGIRKHEAKLEVGDFEDTPVDLQRARPGDVVTRDITLRPLAGRLTGRLVDSRGRPCRGAELSQPCADGTSSWCIESDGAGRLSVRRPEPGRPVILRLRRYHSGEPKVLDVARIDLKPGQTSLGDVVVPDEVLRYLP